MSGLRAWHADAGEWSQIIFAATRGRARYLAWTRGDGFSGLDSFVDFSVTRCPKADRFATEEGPLSWYGHTREYREIGWFEDEGSEQCEACRLHEFRDIPESKVGEDGLCGECRGQVAWVPKSPNPWDAHEVKPLPRLYDIGLLGCFAQTHYPGHIPECEYEDGVCKRCGLGVPS